MRISKAFVRGLKGQNPLLNLVELVPIKLNGLINCQCYVAAPVAVRRVQRTALRRLNPSFVNDCFNFVLRPNILLFSKMVNSILTY